MDEETVQQEQVSEETTSQEGEKPLEGEKPSEPQPFSEEQEARMQQLLAEATSKGVETGERRMQSTKDREVAAAERRRKQAEGEASAYKTSFEGLDEETRGATELVHLRSRVKGFESFEQEERTRREQDAYFQKLDESLANQLDLMGIPKDHKDVDWAKDAPDYFAGKARFDVSVAKILKENAKVTEQKAEDKFKEMETKLRKDLGLDSVDTTTSPGAGSDDEFIAKYNSGELNSPADHKRAAEILKKQ